MREKRSRAKFPPLKRISILILVLGLTANSAAIRSAAEPSALASATPGRILLVVAHPDDEYDMAATVYRIAMELSGVVDEIVITDGEAGYHYSSLAERYYGVALTDDSASRARLAQIRVQESRRAAKVLGIRQQWFLEEKNIPFTSSPDSPLRESWHAKRVLESISQRLKEGQYDFVFVLLPEAETHGEHKAATILTLEAVNSLAGEHRPVVLGASAGNDTQSSYEPIPGQSLTKTLTAEPEFHFDRNVHFGYRQSLSYQIVVDWVIAEHKSQGLFQTKCLQDRFENFWIFGIDAPEAPQKAAALFAAASGADTGAGKTQDPRAEQIGPKN